ncbi:ADP-ribosylation factor GTPase-activating protein [Musa troglodytarum]|uniref:ADP-ribosylation factor GTPase-activating protein n=1 Tax=Musa troglodytarum TaxID=320322 RepID=A0A9E7HTR5_9LILI|nr:ADP-ribosylation factor GTPase-activating protein [Musa troglodytarum]
MASPWPQGSIISEGLTCARAVAVGRCLVRHKESKRAQRERERERAAAVPLNRERERERHKLSSLAETTRSGHQTLVCLAQTETEQPGPRTHLIIVDWRSESDPRQIRRVGLGEGTQQVLCCQSTNKTHPVGTPHKPKRLTGARKVKSYLIA